MRTRLDRALPYLIGLLGLLILAASLNPLFRKTPDPPSSACCAPAPAQPDPVNQVKQAVARANEAFTHAEAVAALKLTPPPQPKPVVPVVTPVPAPSPTVVPAAPVATGTTNWAASSFGACVRSRENGGSYAWGTGNGGGAYQFLYSTWTAHGGAGSMYGNADAAYQDMIFNNTVTADGFGDWRPYDGC